MNNPIYMPKGRAGEYGQYALNIYTGCPHRCFYCFAPSVLRKDREQFHTDVRPRDGILESVRRQLDTGSIKDALIHLCFMCDPYPKGVDSSVTRDIIRLIKASGNHVQLLSKNPEIRDLDLLDGNDWYGITYTGGDVFSEPGAEVSPLRFKGPFEAHKRGIKTWISLEPVLDASDVLELLKGHSMLKAEGHAYIDRFKIGKLNYWPSDTDWKAFGQAVKDHCIREGLDYIIKADLRAEMER
jgi:DNA repair photolyase